MTKGNPRRNLLVSKIAPMAYSPTEMLDLYLRDLEAQIRKVFHGVTREGGISWSEARVLDDYCCYEWGVNAEHDRMRREARAKDTEESWEELVYDLNWRTAPSGGNWSFLDPIGFRYYLAAALVRYCVRRDLGDELELMLDFPQRSDLPDSQTGKRLSLCTADQFRAIARFVRLMSVRDTLSTHGEFGGREWLHIYSTGWYLWENPSPFRSYGYWRLPDAGSTQHPDAIAPPNTQALLNRPTPAPPPPPPPQPQPPAPPPTHDPAARRDHPPPSSP
jgi:hypothetical protein